MWDKKTKARYFLRLVPFIYDLSIEETALYPTLIKCRFWNNICLVSFLSVFRSSLHGMACSLCIWYIFFKLLRTNLSEENIPDHQFHCYEIKQPVGVCFHVLV